MSRRANCWDNAVAESFFSTLKTELVGDRVYTTQAQARLAVFDHGLTKFLSTASDSRLRPV